MNSLLRPAHSVLVRDQYVGTVVEVALRTLIDFFKRILLPVLAALLQLVVLFPFTSASGLLAPLGAVVLLHVLWFLHAVGLVVLLRRRSGWALLVPLVNALLWWLTMTFGDIVLGWTA